MSYPQIPRLNNKAQRIVSQQPGESVEEVRESKSLTIKQQLFCEEYLIDLNATAAYRRAGYSGANKKAAEVNANRLLKNDKVQAYIQELREERRKKIQLQADDIAYQLKAIAFTNIANILTFNNEEVIIKDISEIDSVTLSAIQSISIRGGRVEIKMADKVAALKTLATMFGLDMSFEQALLALEKYDIKLTEIDGKWQCFDRRNKENDNE